MIAMTGTAREHTVGVVREIAADVFCLGPRGRTQTNIYFVRSGSAWVLIDAGWARDAERVERAAGSLFGAGSRAVAILLTHDHPDDEGSALRLAHTWQCAVYLHPKELPVAVHDFDAMVATAMPLDRWIVLPLMRAMGRRRREAVFARASLGAVARLFDPDAGVPGLPGWRCIATPGHTPGHVSFFRPHDRVLITGDAVVTLRMDSLTAPGPGAAGKKRRLAEAPRSRMHARRLACMSDDMLTLAVGGRDLGATVTDASRIPAGGAHDVLPMMFMRQRTRGGAERDGGRTEVPTDSCRTALAERRLP
jgi:glyoxylase-like metal-dependent hydrolase (beta-lactamase superfamily II)